MNHLAAWPLATLLIAIAGCSTIKNPVGPVGDTVAPTVTATNPINGATGVGGITALFSEAMDVSTITAISFSIRGPGSSPVTGTVSYAASTDMARFTPSLGLTAGTVYTATISTAATDVAGNAMAGNYMWTFTTNAASGGGGGGGGDRPPPRDNP
jgi:hypothetical protein